MNKNTKKGFTLVELLAVIAVLGLILIIAVPKITKTMDNSKRRTLELSVKSIARSAEEAYIENESFGITDEITCESVSSISSDEYEFCEISFDDDGNASVTYIGKGSYDGLYVCNGTKTNATVQEESCTPVVNAINFADDDWSTIVASVQSGNHPYEVGNTKTVDMGSLGVHTLRVANTTKCSEVTVESKTACGFVLEFEDVITIHEMNGDSVNVIGSTNLGGWAASEMRAYLNDLNPTSNDDGVIYNALPEELRNGIINTYVVSSYGSDKTTGVVENENAGVLESELYWSNDKLYLLSTEEVWVQGDSNTIDYDISRGTSRQLDYYVNNNVTTSNYSGAVKTYGEEGVYWWWLRSAHSSGSDGFYGVNYRGDWGSNYSPYSYGVSPAFRLAD